MTETQRPRAVIYTRISKDREGRELGVQRQEEDSREHARRLGYEVIDVFPENDVSASTRSRKPRPQYKAMVQLVRDGGCEAIIAYKSSRLTRRPLELEHLIQLWEETGVKIHTVASGDYDFMNSRGRRRARDDAARDAEYAEEVGELVAREAQQRAERGEWHGGPNPPLGYEFTPIEREAKRSRDGEPKTKTFVTLKVDPQQKALANEAAKRLVAGEKFHGICQSWNARGLRTRSGSRWTPPNLRRAMLSPALAGLTKTAKGFHKAEWPAVLDRDVWDRLQVLLASDGSGGGQLSKPGPWGKVALGKGLSVCGLCGENLIATKYHIADERRLQCTTLRNGGCGKVAIGYTWFEAHVFSAMVDRVQTDEFVAALDLAKSSAPDDKRRDLHQHLREIAAERERVLTNFEKGYRTEAVTDAAMADLQRREAKTRDDIAALPISEEIYWNHNNIHEVWEQADLSQRRALAESLIIKIEVGPHPKGVSFRPPAQRAGEDPTTFAMRRGAYWLLVMEKRITIHWRHTKN